MLSIFAPYADFGFLILTLAVAVIFIYHGWPKFTKPEGMANGMGWSPAVVRLLGAVEILGGLGIALGLFPRLSALALSAVMLGAIWTKINKWRIPFSTQANTGWEFDLILFAVTLFILTNTI